MSDNMENETVESTEQPMNENVKTFTQDELDRIVADRIARERKKFDKQLEGVDISEAKRLLQEKEAAELERQKERGEFEQVLKKTVEKKEQEILTYKQKLEQTLVDGELLRAASTNNAVSPEQVSALLKNRVRLADSGSVEVLDTDGTPMYNDSGDLLSVSELVNDFLTTNPHFVRASQSGTGSKGAVGGSTQKPQSVAEMVANWSNGGREAYAALQRKK